MRVLRSKQIRKALKFYRMAFGITQPYQILLDGNFVVIAFQMKVDISARVPSFLQTNKYSFYTTRCVLEEMEQLGSGFEPAVVFARETCKIKKCGHKDPVPANECILSVVGPRNDAKLFVGTQDAELKAALRGVPGVPLFHMNRSVLVFEPPSQASRNASFQKEESKVSAFKSREKELLQKYQSADEGAPDEKQQQQRRLKRRAKGPNPLSCKKAKVEKATEQKSAEQERKPEKKRKRKRSKKSGAASAGGSSSTTTPAS